jgi:peptidyl-prolyl cis-trans isomerase C
MSSRFFSTPVFAVLFLVVAAAAQAADPAVSGDPVVARIDGMELHRSDVDAARQDLPPQAQKLPIEQIYPILLDRLVDSALVAEAGRKEHMEQDPTVQRRLRAYEDRLIQQAYLTHKIDTGTSEDRLKARYEAFLKEQPAHEEVRARHILVKTEAEAKSIIAELEKGADFAELAKKHSTDTAAGEGGDLGYFARDEMLPEFSEAAFATPAGKFTKTPVKTEFGWHVIKVEDHRVKQPPSFDEARAEIGKLLARDIIEANVKELRQHAKIETFGIDGKPLPVTK